MTEYNNLQAKNNNLPILTETIGSINQSLQMTNNLILQMNDELSVIKDGQRKADLRIQTLEENTEITRRQADNIKKKVKELARDLVGYPSDIYGVTIGDIYRYLRDYYDLATAVGDTEKRFYIGITEGLESYSTKCFDIERIKKHKADIEAAKAGA